MLRETKLERGVKERLALVVWPEVVGPFAAKHSRAFILRRKVLLVQVPNSTWAQELSLMRPQLIPRLNERVGIEVVRDVRFLVDPGLERGGAHPDRTREGSLAVRPDGREEETGAPGAAGPVTAIEADPAFEETLSDEMGQIEPWAGAAGKMKWERLRRLARRRFRWLRRQGWGRCIICGRLAVPAGARADSEGGMACPFCVRQGARDRVMRARECLMRSPWLSSAEVRQNVTGLTAEEEKKARNLAARAMFLHLRELAARGGGSEGWPSWVQKVQEYVLLASGLPAARVGPAQVEAALGELLPVWRRVVNNEPENGR